MDMDKDSKICIVGHKGALGYALWTKLAQQGYTKLSGVDLPEYDLTNQASTDQFFAENKPEYVIFVAAVAAGISYKKTHPVEMLLNNLQMTTNVLSSAQKYGVKKLVNICSALLYPSSAEIPIHEEDATYVKLDEIDTPYAMAKAAGMQLCRYFNQQMGTNFLTVVPCNFFGARAPFDGDKAGVVPALIQRMHKAKLQKAPSVVAWGSGNACREFMNSLDVADAIVFLLEHDTPYDLINVGRGNEVSIRETAEIIKKVVGYCGELIYDAEKPEGRPHMMLNTSKLFSMGWRPTMSVEESIRQTYEWYLQQL